MKISELKLACGKPVCEHEGPVYIMLTDEARNPVEQPVWALRASVVENRIEVPGVGGGYRLQYVYSTRESAMASVRDRLAKEASEIHAELNKNSYRNMPQIKVTQHRDDATGDYVVRIKTDERVWSIAAANGPDEAELIVEALRGVIRAHRSFDPCDWAFDRLYRYVNGNTASA